MKFVLIFATIANNTIPSCTQPRPSQQTQTMSEDPLPPPEACPTDSDDASDIANQVTNRLRELNMRTTHVDPKYTRWLTQYKKIVDNNQRLNSLRIGKHDGKYIFQDGVDLFFATALANRSDVTNDYVISCRNALKKFCKLGEESEAKVNVSVQLYNVLCNRHNLI